MTELPTWIVDLRKKVLNGEPVVEEELRKALEFLRQDRMTAATKKKKKVEEELDLTELFKL